MPRLDSRPRAAALSALALLGSLGAAAAGPVPSTELKVGDTTLVDNAAVPPTVFAASGCDGAGLDYVERRPFAGRVLFSIKCPSNNHNWNESLVFADDESGRGAALVLFPDISHVDEGSIDQLSNVRIFPRTRTVGEIAVDDEHAAGAPCRFESLFRFKGGKPRLVFHRNAKQCDAENARWRVKLDKRTAAEREEDWN